MGKRGRDESIEEKARAAVTLNSLNSEFRFLGKDTKSVLDLCAGCGWMQLAVARISKGGFVLGVDLHPITPILGAISIQEDITTRVCRDTIRKRMTENGFTGFDVVMRGGLSSDSRATTWDQASLLTTSIKHATKFLSSDGTFVTKMFDGAEDYNPMLYCLEQIKRICKDLRVLNKRRFVHLMKWRLHVREALSHAQKAKAADAKDGNKGNDDNDDEIPDEMEYSEDVPEVS